MGCQVFGRAGGNFLLFLIYRGLFFLCGVEIRLDAKEFCASHPLQVKSENWER